MRNCHSFRMSSFRALFAVCSRSLLVCLVLAGTTAFANAPDGAEKTPAAKTSTWAHIELKGSYPEGPQMLSLFGDISESLSDTIARLDKAAKDDSIQGVVLKLKSPEIGRGKLNEFRQA